MKPDSHLGPYEIREKLGRGGMGEVFRAFDPRLDREVAIKILPGELAHNRNLVARFEREAKALAAVRHSGVVTVFSVEEDDGVPFLTMELVEGEALAGQIPAGGFQLARFYELAIQLADALAAAHSRGIVHRDLKPANIMVDGSGDAVLLDFGLVKRVAHADSEDEATLLQEERTAAGVVMGTLEYMSPEQVRGEEVDARSDVFSLGTVYYEMLTGGRPFTGESRAEVVASILRQEHPSAASVRPEAPPELLAVVDRCLAKAPADRFESAAELREALRAAAEAAGLEVPSSGSGSKVVNSNRFALMGLGAVVLLGLGVGAWLWNGHSKEKWVQDEVVPRVEALVTGRNEFQAFALLQEARRTIPDHPELERLLAEISFPKDFVTEPPGARVRYRDYDRRDSEWIELGESPIEKVRVPDHLLIVEVSKDGYLPIERQFFPVVHPSSWTLTEETSAPPGMVKIDAGRVALWSGDPIALDSYWLDRFEVTNQKFKVFVDGGGYEDPKYWQHPFREDGVEISFEQAMARFVDRTGRPGPALWELGEFPSEEGQQPVRGVSWYEAAAYAEFVGKSLPTVYHWRGATPQLPMDDLVRMGNLEGDEVGDVGSFGAVSPWGVHDLAGNVAEWTFNETGDRRYLLGGAFHEPRYVYANDLAQAPMERSETNGFRCALYPEEPPTEAFAPTDIERVDFSRLEPVSDEVFDVYRNLYAYDPAPLDPTLDAVDETSPYWRKETVSYDAAYGGERVLGHLFLPNRSRAPYQTVVFFPSAAAWAFPTSERLSDLSYFDFLPRSGLAFFHPIYKGTYERQQERTRGPAELRQRWVEAVQDLRRSVDYLLTRDDIDGERLAFMALSLGSEYGAIMTSIETRFKVSVLLAGGFDDTHMMSEPSEIQPWHYAPRVRTPTLMINGELDFGLPIETGQKPLYEMLGVPESDKRYVVLPGGHLPNDQHAIARESLDWLEKYLGPVSRSDT